jgi:hypothetical protein
MHLKAAKCKDRTDTVAQGFYVSQTPDFLDYAHHVKQYNRRELTYPEDGLDGISGVLSVLGTVFEGGFIAGLPVMFFGQAFWWWHMKPLQKKKSQIGRWLEKACADLVMGGLDRRD